MEAWWRNSIGYIIYPAAYKDANGDGIGDLKGIIEKLDYLRELGIDLLWICPIFASPMKDNGYDVSDYLHVNPLFGTDEDLLALLHEAHLRGIRVLLDFAMNHTSDQHEWFVKAKEDPSSEERSYYIIKKGRRDEKGNLLPPNNWGSFFSTSAWEKMPNSEDEFYLHVFAPSMPDTDWSNPKLRERYYQIARHYVDLGVDGFRMDAISHLAKNPTFEDSPLRAGKEGCVLDPSEFSNRPELLAYLKEFREKGVNENTLLVGEVGGCVQPAQARLFSERGRGPINLVFNFDTVWNNGAYGSVDKKDEEIKTDVISLKNNFMRWYENAATCDLPLYWCNHDHPRVLSQYGSVNYRAESAKMLVTTLLFLYGTPFIYQGDEIGMSNVTYDKVEDFLNDFVELYGSKKWGLSAWTSNTGLIRNYILPLLAGKCVQDITPRTVDLFIHELQGTKPVESFRKSKQEFVTACTIEKIVKLMRTAFRQAVRWGLIGSNPFDNAVLPKREKKERAIWDVKTIRKALDECEDGRLFIALNLAFACSMRLGEITGLQWDCVDISDRAIANDDASIRIERELERVDQEAINALGNADIIMVFPRVMAKKSKTRLVLKKPKTDTSIRTVWIPKTLALILREWRQRQEAWKEFMGEGTLPRSRISWEVAFVI